MSPTFCLLCCWIKTIHPKGKNLRRIIIKSVLWQWNNFPFKKEGNFGPSILTVIDNVWQFWQFWQFWRLLTILTIFDKFWQCWQFLQFLTIFDDYGNFDILWPICQFLPILACLDFFLTILDQYKNINKDNHRALWHLRHWLQYWLIWTILTMSDNFGPLQKYQQRQS